MKTKTIDALGEKVIAHLKENHSLRNLRDQMKAKISMLENEIKELTRLNTALGNDINKLKKENSQFQSELNKTNLTLKDQKAENAQLNKTADEIKKKLEKEIQMNGALTNRLNEMTTLNKKQTEEIVALQKKLTNKDGQTV